jgi:hypothetical protein
MPATCCGSSCASCPRATPPFSAAVPAGVNVKGGGGAIDGGSPHWRRSRPGAAHGARRERRRRVRAPRPLCNGFYSHRTALAINTARSVPLVVRRPAAGGWPLVAPLPTTAMTIRCCTDVQAAYTALCRARMKNPPIRCFAGNIWPANTRETDSRLFSAPGTRREDVQQARPVTPGRCGFRGGGPHPLLFVHTCAPQHTRPLNTPGSSTQTTNVAVFNVATIGLHHQDQQQQDARQKPTLAHPCVCGEGGRPARLMGC